MQAVAALHETPPSRLYVVPAGSGVVCNFHVPATWVISYAIDGALLLV